VVDRATLGGQTRLIGIGEAQVHARHVGGRSNR
jgi:hypothetical protein